MKLSCPLTEEQCRTLMKGVPLPMRPDYPPLLQKLLLQMRTRLLRPVIIVDYDRVPYVCKDGNVRITMDKNIPASRQAGSVSGAGDPQAAGDGERQSHSGSKI